MPNTTVLHERLTSLFSTTLNRDVPSIDTDLFDTGVLDSLAFVELLLHLEREFGVSTTVNDMEVENFQSIASIARFLTVRSARAPVPAAEPAAVEVRARG